MKRLFLAILVLLATDARAAGYDDAGDDLAEHPGSWVRLDGSLRMRGDLLDNLDLDRGLDPAGRPIFAVPPKPDGQLLTQADSRLRADLSAFAPGGGLAVRTRFDLFDGTALAAPSGQASPGAVRPRSVLQVRQAYGEVLLPVGLLSAGRLPVRWGLGMLANDGACPDCDGGDAADGVSFATPMAGLIWSASWAFATAGAFDARPEDGSTVGFAPSAPANVIALAALRWRGPESLRRRRAAGRTTVDWGVLLTERWQHDRTGSYGASSGSAAGALRSPAYRAGGADGWLRLTFPRLRVEAEAALLAAKVPQPSMIPGVELPHPVRSTQMGGAVETEWSGLASHVGLGIDAGFASGDPAPGFGAEPVYSGRTPQAGDLEDPQAVPPGDYRVDNFRFHPDYRVDRILFHELIGTVTDAVYVRPHGRVALARWTTGELRAELAAVGSRAIDASSTPGGKAPLGIEVDPTLAWEGASGFSFALEHAVLFPLAGLDNPAAGLTAQPAQRIALRMSWGF